ncbi:MAG: metallopeptidase TldD-related protein [Nitrososphaeria archaeon]|nr:TldD/PmbA family protein [Conexivisphaerales archaeon]
MILDRVKQIISNAVDQYSLIESDVDEYIIRFYNGKVTVAAVNRSTYIQMLATKGRKKVFKVLTDMQSLEKGVEDALKTLEIIEEGEVPEVYPKTSYSNMEISDKEIAFDEALSKVINSVDKAYSAGVDRIAGIAKLYKTTYNLLTSTGNENEEKRTDYIYYARAFKGNGSGFGNSVSTSIKRFDPESAAAEAAEYAKISESPKSIPEGKYTVILSPPIASAIFELVAGMCSAYSIDVGFSFLKDRLGETIAPEGLSMTDYGQISDGVNSRSFDDEGAPTGSTKLIEKGRFVSVIHNSTTAKKWRTKTTGNAGIIDPSPWNVIIDGGDVDNDEMIKEIKEGVLITNNWYTRFNNYRTGEFSTIIRDAALYIKNGEISHPVANIRLSDSLPRLLTSIKMISKNTKWVKWWGEVVTPVKSPYITVEGATLTVP